MGPEYTCPGIPSIWKEEAGWGLVSTFLSFPLAPKQTYLNILDTAEGSGSKGNLFHFSLFPSEY